MKSIVLYNPYSANHTGEKLAHELDNILKGQLIYYAMPNILDFEKFLDQNKEDIIICGGDGTLNYFINHTKNIKYKNDILYFATGSGNDFLNDIGPEKGKYPFSIKKYLENLPKVIVKNEEYLFLNGVGFGLDGYCTMMGDIHKTKSKKPVNYTKIALKGLFFDFKPLDATIEVDGKTYKFSNVWLAPSMNGRFYGGGMMIAPMQDRENIDKTLTLVIVHAKNKINLLTKFPSIFKGEHLKYTKYVTFIFGKHIKVSYNKKQPLQIDGETILDVESYEAFI